MSNSTGGETRSSPSGWSTDTLKAYIERIIEEHDRRYEQRFVAQQASLEAALRSATLAVTKAETAVEKRLENTNEWRAAMSDRDKNLLPRSEFNSILKEWEGWRDGIGNFRETLATRVSVIETRIVTWVSALAIFFTVIQAAMYWVFRR